MGGEREHVGDQVTVRGHLDGLGIDEGLVEAGLLDDTTDFVEEATSCSVESRSHRSDRFPVLDRPVVGTAGDHAVPHVHLADQAREQRPDGGIVVDTFEREHDWSVQPLVVETLCTGYQLSDEPDVVLEHTHHQIHLGPFCSGGDPKATGWMEMHVILRRKLDLARRVTPVRRGHPIRATKGPGECLVRGIARLHRDLEDPIGPRCQAIRRSLQQNPPPELIRCLTRRSPDQSIEVVAR
jgi:hypothetical protein